MTNRPSWVDAERVAALRKQLPTRSASPRVRTLQGSRPSLANVSTLKDYTRAHAFAKELDLIDQRWFGSGFKPYMRHAR